MFARLFRRDSQAFDIASAIYGAIVTQARTPALYAALGVPDTVDGRFEMVVLHTILVLDRLGREDARTRSIGQLIFDLHCQDMDRSLRELGIGDLGVPKRMKKMAEAFYGRAATYRDAIAAGDRSALTTALMRNVYRDTPSDARAAALAGYVMSSAERIAAAPALSGPPPFADPAAFIPTGVGT
jgi:cytochrome b pre-mRNA-processing protein 3